ncbi:MAG: DNA gyrase inhibitor YacG [Pseudomonadota bacterium]
MKVRCPRCGKEGNWEGNPFRPFCSERCKLIDLGQWIDGSYVIPGESVDGEKTDEEEKPS